MTENPWGETASTIPPIVSETRPGGAVPTAGRTDRPDRRTASGTSAGASAVTVGNASGAAQTTSAGS
ncbi:MAG: hypothetical protein H0X35_09520 [Pseudonocardiales bacterium]|nr:hypothetical protein [Pseudonocardiales bacterium]